MATLGSSAGGSADRVIVVRVQYAYASPIGYALAETWDLTESAFRRAG